MQTASAQFKTMVEGNELTVEETMAITLPLVRTNICPCPNFESGLGKWFTSGGVSIATSSIHAASGTQSMLATWATGAADSQIIILDISPYTTLLNGSRINLSMQVWLDTNAPNVYMWNGTGNTVSTKGSWQELHLTVDLTAGGTNIILANASAAVAGANCRMWVDNIIVEETNVVSPSYFDGNSGPGAAWLGIPNLSASTLNVSPYPDITLAIESSTLVRQLTTSMPDGTLLVTGYPTAAATIVLSGLVDPTDDTKTAAWLFNTCEATSPMYHYDVVGAPVTLKHGLYDADDTSATPEMITSFTGYVDDAVVDTAAGTVTLSCLDNRTKLRSTPALPALSATMDIIAGAGFGALVQQTPGLRSSYILDALLRVNGYYSSPGPRTSANVLFYASFVGSAYPQTFFKSGYPVQASNSGTYVGETASTVMKFVPGAFNQDICRDVSLLCSLDLFQPTYPWPTDIDFQPGGGYFHEWWMNTALPNSADVGGVYAPMQVNLMTTDFDFAVVFTSSIKFTPITALSWTFTDPTNATHTVTTTGAWQQFDVQVTFGGTVGAVTATTKLWIDQVLAGTWTAALPVSPVAGTGPDTISIVSEYPIEAFQTTNELAGVPLASFTPTAFLDASLNDLTATTDVTGQDPWQTIQSLAEAELGLAGFDELGIFRFTNRDRLQAVAQRSVASATSLKVMQTETGLSLVTNHVTANVNSIVRSTWQQVWNGVGANITTSGGQQYYYLHTGATDVIYVTLSQPSYVSPLMNVITTGGITTAHPRGGYRAARRPDGTGGEVTNLVFQVEQLSATVVRITITNPNPFIVYFTTPTGYATAAGTPAAIALTGETYNNASQTSLAATTSPVPTSTAADAQWPPVSEGGADPRKAAAVQLADNPWRQDLASVQLLVDAVLVDLYRPRPVVRNLDIVADPRLQLNDRVTLVDPDSSKMNDDVVLIGITTNASATAWDQMITARTISMPGGWVMGQPGHSEMGSTTYV